MAAFRAYAVRVLGRIRLFGADGFFGVQRQRRTLDRRRPGYPVVAFSSSTTSRLDSAYMTQPPSRSMTVPPSDSVGTGSFCASCRVEEQLHPVKHASKPQTRAMLAKRIRCFIDPPPSCRETVFHQHIISISMQAHQVNTIICILVEKRETLWNPRINRERRILPRRCRTLPRHARCGCGSIEKARLRRDGLCRKRAVRECERLFLALRELRALACLS